MNINTLYVLIGKTLDICQRIEHDIKIIYASIHEGSFEDNLYQSKRWTLGQTVTELEIIDDGYNYYYFTKEDYRLLKRISNERNYVCHDCFEDFIYEDNYQVSEEVFMKVYNRIDNFYNEINNLWEVIQKIRTDIYNIYRNN